MIELLAVVALLALCLLLLPAAGWWLAMRLHCDDLLRVTAACLAGVTTLAVAELLAYVLRLPQWVAVTFVAGAGLIGARDLAATVRRREFAWDGLLTWGGASAILIAATVPFAVHGRPGALFDWYEHWLRSLIFLQQGPAVTRIGMYSLPARGPLFNASAALLLYVAGSAHYWVFQIVAITFNTVACLPFALFLESVSRVRRRWALLIAALVLVVSPFFFWNNTFTWTKSLTAAFVLMGVHTYLLGYRKGNRDKMAMSLAYLAPGFFCHYLALPYAALLGLHLLLVVPFRELPIRSLIRAGLVWCLLLVPWFGYMAPIFGVRGTLRANTTMGRFYVAKDEQGVPVPLYRVLAANLCTDLLPKPLCRPLLPPSDSSSCVWVVVDGTTEAQTPGTCPVELDWNGIYALLGYSGLGTVLIAAVLSVKPLIAGMRTIELSKIRGSIFGDQFTFLLWVLAAGLLLNLLPIRWFDPGGSFSENLQAWSMVFFAIVVRGLFRLPKLAIVMLAVAMMVEFGAADLRLIRLQTVVLPLANSQSAMDGNLPLGTLLPDPQGAVAFRTERDYYKNYQFKIKGGALFFRDLHPDNYAAVAWAMLAIGGLALAAGQRHGSNHL